jgi:4-amino-4-deoxy-L-arabinose transferase-like glycosyltransferase
MCPDSTTNVETDDGGLFVTPDRRIILALFSLAFGLRIVYAALVGTSPEITPNPYTYDFLMARKIAAGVEWWSQPFSPAAPGYQFMLAAVFKVGGVHRWLVILLQAVLGGALTFVIYRIGERSLGRGAGLLSAIWLAIYVHHMQMSSLMVRDATVTLLFAFVCYLLILYAYRIRGAIWTAIAHSILVHFDPQFLLFVPLIALYLLFRATRHRLLNVQSMFLYLGTCLVLLTPWTIRNYRVYGEPIPVGLEATNYLRPFKTAYGGDEDPGATVTMVESRPGFWRNSTELWRVVRFKESAHPTSDGGMRAVPPWSTRHNLISIANYGLLIPFFLLGVWRAVRNKNQAGLVLSGAIFVYYLTRAFYGAGVKERLPVEPLFILLAFYAIVDLYSRYRARRTSGAGEAQESGGDA